MYLVEMNKENMLNSNIFLRIVRDTLLENIKDSDISTKQFKYIKESMSDAEILSYAMYGKDLDFNESDEIVEELLFEQLKDFVGENTNLFGFNDDYTYDDFIHEVSGLSCVNTSSLLLEVDDDIFKKQAKNMNDLFDKLRRDKYKYVSHDRFGDSQEEVSQKMVDFEKQNKKLQQMADDLRKRYRERQANRTNVEKITDKVKDDITYFGNKIDHVKDNIWSSIRQHKEGIAATVIIATAIYIGYKAYQRYFSKAAKQCKGTGGNARDICLTKAKIKATEQQIQIYKKSDGACKNSTNPKKCRAKLLEKINKSKKRIESLKITLKQQQDKS